MDEIRIRGLNVFAYHGVYEQEQENGQNFIVNATLFTDTRNAGNQDEIDCTVDYGTVCLFIKQYMLKFRKNLLEAITNSMAREILVRFPGVKEIELEIVKPDAPIPLPFDTVSVCVHRKWHTAYVAFGSNMGDKEGYIDEAIANLDAEDTCRVVAVSDKITSSPYGGIEQDDFVNGVMKIETLLYEEELLIRLQEEEHKAGRERLVHWGPRTLDLDILYYDDEVMKTENLIIPHPDMQNRDFVLKPLGEIAPFFRHPVTGKTTLQMLEELKDNYILK